MPLWADQMSMKKFELAKQKQQKLQHIGELFPRKQTVGSELGKTIGHILVDRKNRIVTDKNGWIRFWFNQTRAEKDAKFLSRRLGVDLKVEKNSLKLWTGRRISRIEI